MVKNEEQIKKKVEEILMLATLLGYKINRFKEKRVYLYKGNKSMYLFLNYEIGKFFLYVYIDSKFNEKIKDDCDIVIEKIMEML